MALILRSFPPHPTLEKNPKLLPDDAAQGDQPDEQKQRSRKDRKGKKKKNKRDKDSDGKGKRKGKGKKGSRRKKHEENELEDGFLRVPTALSDIVQPTQLPEIQKGLETMIPAEDFGQFFTATPTQELQSGTEAESEVAEEVDRLTRRPSDPACSLQP